MGNTHGKPVVFTDEVNLNHFRLLRVVGKGAFGKVRIVERKDTGLTFALKYIRKDEVVRSESVRNIIRERRMLEHLNHPFLCNLRYSFQDIEYLYLVVDLMNGGDLRFHISRKTFTEDAVQFWIAELGCAVRYIHQQGIVHRDIKPDNVLLDSEGHVHLADFNVASDFTPAKPLMSKSGTLAYLAPEVYEARGYTCDVDWWSLGVLFYECIYNKRPFDSSAHESLSENIIRAHPSFPVTNPPVTIPCMHAISSLLEKDPRKRIGAAGFETLAQNPFFQNIDFIALERKEIEPIFIPAQDKTNFDATYDLEELLLEEAPLEARARRQKPREQLREDATQQEIRAEELHKMIETLFEPFNYTTVPIERRAMAGDASPVSTSVEAPSPSASDPRPLSNHDTVSRASTQSPSGSPPLPTTIPVSSPTSDPSSLQHPAIQNLHPGDISRAGSATPPSGSRAALNRSQRGNSKNVTTSGGMSVVLSETGSWKDLNDQRLPVDERAKPSGVLGFLGRKRGRERSPKARERGVLGKEGARVVVGSG